MLRALSHPILAVMLLSLAFVTLGKTGAADPSGRAKPVGGAIALNGFDPVAYFLVGEARQGQSDIALRWRGVRWHFTSKAHRNAFEANPHAYAPQFAGHCAMGVAEGRRVPADPRAWVVHDGRLYLFETAAQHRRALNDLSHTTRQATGLWLAEQTR